MIKVNLHTHSNKSDGVMTPYELVRKLHRDGVEVVSLTDHDTISGLAEATKTAREFNLGFINGIEISTDISELKVDFLDSINNTIHLLGLGFDIEKFNRFTSEREQAKIARIKQLIVQLNEAGYYIVPKNIIKKKSEVAKLLVNRGYATNVQDAFNRIINNFYNRHIDNFKVSDAINIIHSSGGVVIWAHPFEILLGIKKQSISINQIDLMCERLKSYNIDGIETYYRNYSSEQKMQLKKIKDKYNFISSAGTDYHAKSSSEKSYYEIDRKLIKEVIKLKDTTEK